MTKELIIEDRIQKIVDRINRGNLKWSAMIKTRNGLEYNVPEQTSQNAFVSLLRPIITEIVNSEE